MDIRHILCPTDVQAFSSERSLALPLAASDFAITDVYVPDFHPVRARESRRSSPLVASWRSHALAARTCGLGANRHRGCPQARSCTGDPRSSRHAGISGGRVGHPPVRGDEAHRLDGTARAGPPCGRRPRALSHPSLNDAAPTTPRYGVRVVIGEKVRNVRRRTTRRTRSHERGHEAGIGHAEV